MDKRKEVYEMAIMSRLVMHEFKDSSCMFYVGFKFEKKTTREGVFYNIYNTRTSVYSDLDDFELDCILVDGIHRASALSSYKAYDKLLTRYSMILDNKKANKKTIDKSARVVEDYRKKCQGILDKYPGIIG